VPSNYAELETRPEVVALAAAEGIMTHGVIALGQKNLGKPLTFSEHVVLVHGGTHPLLYNLALEAAGVPDFLLTLTILPLPPAVPYIPGPGVSGLVPGIPPVLPASVPVLPVAPLDPFTANALAALAGPGCFAFASNPGTVHQFQVSGTANPAASAGGHRYDFYVSACYAPSGAPRSRVAKFSIGMFVPGAA
jgi:hypothetical protein